MGGSGAPGLSLGWAIFGIETLPHRLCRRRQWSSKRVLQENWYKRRSGRGKGEKRSLIMLTAFRYKGRCSLEMITSTQFV